jgi:hypothetical protein
MHAYIHICRYIRIHTETHENFNEEVEAVFAILEQEELSGSAADDSEEHLPSWKECAGSLRTTSSSSDASLSLPLSSPSSSVDKNDW